jgi:predicted MPP superfamily phosphohydrolase
MSTILVIQDLQVPFHHKDALKFLAAVKKKYKPTIIVQIGDLADQHHFSRYSNSTKGKGGKDEMDGAADALKPFIRLFPRVYVCWGNHDLRIFQRASDVGIDDSLLKSYNEMLNMPKGWKIDDKWEFDGVIFEHGIGRSGSQGALKAAMANMQSTVIGHLHSHAGILYYANKKSLIYGFNVGALIDDRKYAFEYGRFTSGKSVLGCGIIINGLPIFVPMLLTKDHNWVGKL